MAALEAVQGDLSAVSMMREAFARRAVTMHRMLNAIPGVVAIEPQGAFYAPLWAVYGVVDTVQYKALSQSMSGWLIWLYILIGSIVLVNLLVAMMSDTYGRMQVASEREFYFVRYKRIFELKHILHPLPPCWRQLAHRRALAHEARQ